MKRHLTSPSGGNGESYAESQDWTVVGAFDDLDVSAIKQPPWARRDLGRVARIAA